MSKQEIESKFLAIINEHLKALEKLKLDIEYGQSEKSEESRFSSLSSLKKGGIQLDAAVIEQIKQKIHYIDDARSKLNALKIKFVDALYGSTGSVESQKDILSEAQQSLYVAETLALECLELIPSSQEQGGKIQMHSRERVLEDGEQERDGETPQARRIKVGDIAAVTYAFTYASEIEKQSPRIAGLRDNLGSQFSKIILGEPTLFVQINTKFLKPFIAFISSFIPIASIITGFKNVVSKISSVFKHSFGRDTKPEFTSASILADLEKRTVPASVNPTASTPVLTKEQEDATSQLHELLVKSGKHFDQPPILQALPPKSKAYKQYQDVLSKISSLINLYGEVEGLQKIKQLLHGDLKTLGSLSTQVQWEKYFVTIANSMSKEPNTPEYWLAQLILPVETFDLGTIQALQSLQELVGTKQGQDFFEKEFQKLLANITPTPSNKEIIDAYIKTLVKIRHILTLPNIDDKTKEQYIKEFLQISLKDQTTDAQKSVSIQDASILDLTEYYKKLASKPDFVPQLKSPITTQFTRGQAHSSTSSSSPSDKHTPPPSPPIPQSERPVPPPPPPLPPLPLFSSRPQSSSKTDISENPVLEKGEPSTKPTFLSQLFLSFTETKGDDIGKLQINPVYEKWYSWLKTQHTPRYEAIEKIREIWRKAMIDNGPYFGKTVLGGNGSATDYDGLLQRSKDQPRPSSRVE